VLNSNAIGTLLGGRGCITAGAANEYIVTVVWQGLTQTVAPQSTCGQNSYGDEKLRRAVSMRVQISTLSAI
jgi:type IV pilus assembly protein PilV